MKLTKAQQAALASYLRSALASVGAVLATGSTDPEDIVKAVMVAVLPPLLRWANPKDGAFGRGASSC